jgi:hypothetical protein
VNEIIDQTKYENMTIITLLCPEMVPFKPQIGFQLFVSLLCSIGALSLYFIVAVSGLAVRDVVKSGMKSS